MLDYCLLIKKEPFQALDFANISIIDAIRYENVPNTVITIILNMVLLIFEGLFLVFLAIAPL